MTSYDSTGQSHTSVLSCTCVADTGGLAPSMGSPPNIGLAPSMGSPSTGPVPITGSPRCGNGVVDPGEPCDGATVSTTCSAATAGAAPVGTVVCRACQLDLSGCQMRPAVPPPSGAGGMPLVPRPGSGGATGGAFSVSGGSSNQGGSGAGGSSGGAPGVTDGGGVGNGGGGGAGPIDGGGIADGAVG